MENPNLLSELEHLKISFDGTAQKLIKNLRRQEIIMARSDKRQRIEYDELQKKYDEVALLNREIEDTQREVVFMMGTIGEFRSRETGNHVQRVASYSKLFGKLIGISETDAELLKQASPLHDIGKIAIPDAILNKNGPLTNKEFETMKNHAQLGYDMLDFSDRPILKTAAIIALEHHEKYDGSGYPNALKGENIHIFGRITALADVFDALGSKRCYKEAWEDVRIFDLIKEQRGRHFDPKLVDIFFENIEVFLEIRDKFSDD